jgi:hypothetical protein
LRAGGGNNSLPLSLPARAARDFFGGWALFIDF